MAVCLLFLVSVVSVVYSDTVQEYSVSYTIIWEDTYEEISSSTITINGMYGRKGVEDKAYRTLGFSNGGRKRTDNKDANGKWRYQKVLINSVDFVREYQTRS
jgi:hypothetical protein